MTTGSNVARFFAPSMTFSGVAVVSVQAQDCHLAIVNNSVIDPQSKLDAIIDTRPEGELRHIQNNVKPTR